MASNRQELQLLAESQRTRLPKAFFEDLEVARVDIAMGRWPEVAHFKGRRRGWKPRLRVAILRELRALICGGDPKYREVRVRGTKLGTLAVGAVAGYVYHSLGDKSLDLGLVTGAVAFFALAIGGVTRNVFCALVDPGRTAPAANAPTAAKSANSPKTRSGARR